MKKIIVVLVVLFSQSMFGQSQPQIELSGFLDVFYAYDFNKPEGNSRETFLYNHNRHNEFNLNLGLLRLSIDHEKYRSTIAIQTGVYSNDNYIAESGLLKSVFEANVGVSLNDKNNLWLDVGVLPSHIGFESAISMDNYTLTRSLSAENSPYFLTGAKLTYSPNENWEFAGLVTNGWQRIQRVEGNSLLSFGSQVVYSPNQNIKLNWSSFIGTDDPDISRRMRIFNNFYGDFKITERLNMITGFDIGVQQQSKRSSNYDVWLTPVVITHFKLDEKWSSAIRYEYYHDPENVIVSEVNYDGFRTSGVSLNIDYGPTNNVMIRLEGRSLQKFPHPENNFTVFSSIAVKI